MLSRFASGTAAAVVAVEEELAQDTRAFDERARRRAWDERAPASTAAWDVRAAVAPARRSSPGDSAGRDRAVDSWSACSSLPWNSCHPFLFFFVLSSFSKYLFRNNNNDDNTFQCFSVCFLAELQAKNNNSNNNNNTKTSPNSIRSVRIYSLFCCCCSCCCWQNE